MKLSKHAAEDAHIQSLKNDYEQIIKSQKERILQLREDNNLLSAKVSELESLKSDMVNALMDARAKSGEILRETELRAQSLLQQAERDRQEAEKTAQVYRSSLKDLEQRSEKILRSIQKELASDRSSNIRMLSQ